MTTMTNEELGEIFERILEQMAFAFPDEPESDDPEFERHVHIHYEGLDEEGEVVVSASDGFLREFASGMLGVDPGEIAAEDCVASLRELANVICGEVVHALGGEERRIRLGLPEDGEDPLADGQSTEDKGQPLAHVVEVEGEPLRAVVYHRDL